MGMSRQAKVRQEHGCNCGKRMRKEIVPQLKEDNQYGNYGSDEKNLILRIAEYKENYLSWVTNFELPFSNNLSERALRGAKSKMKIAEQFQSEESAGWYAAIRSYSETCMRNGINEVKALTQLCEGESYTIEELYTCQNDA